jgi:hypothetical protein
MAAGGIVVIYSAIDSGVDVDGCLWGLWARALEEEEKTTMKM